MTKSFWRSNWLFLALLVIGSSAAPSWANTLTVSSTANSGVGTLRQAILNAVPGDTIAFNLNFPAVIAVTGNELTIAKSLTIVGPGVDDLWLDGMSGGNILFNIQPGVTFTISQLGLRNSSSFAISNSGTLTVSHVNFLNNTALTSGARGGAIVNTGTLAVSESTFRGNRATTGGGAIYSTGATTITRCSFVDNQAQVGGAILNDANMTVNASTFSSNKAIEQFGGSGGAIRNNAVLELMDSTLSGNSCNGVGGAIHNHTLGSLTIRGTTISDNSAPNSSPAADAIFRYGVVTISRSIIAGGCGGGALNSTGDNIGTTLSCLTNSAILNDRNNLSLPLDALADNGGPTQTRLLPIGSPAIDAVLVNTADCSGTDQRGVPRPNGNRCDIGAVEMEIVLDSVYVDGFE